MAHAATGGRAGSARAGGKGGRKKLREYLRGLSPGARLSWMAGEECGELLKSGGLTKHQVDAEIARVGEAQRIVAGIVPSPVRLDDWRRGEAFPPPGKLMRRARRVLNREEEPVAWPASYLTGLKEGGSATYDYIVYQDQRRRERMDLGSAPGSASAAGIRALEDRRGEIEYRVDLKAEARADLDGYAGVVAPEELARLRVAFS